MNIPEKLSIAGLARAYAAGETTPRDVVAAIIERTAAQADNPIWITSPSAELVEPYLQRLDGTRPSAEKPLWGIPFAVKDNIDVAGMETTAACPAYAYQPETSATAVERLVQAGAIPVGKTNLDQFATGLVGVRSPYGEVRNALRPELISGGSSSGSAVAVARGLAAFSLGTDTAGSGRVPAALNDLVGFKPALGAWSTAGVVPACASLDCVTVFAHSLGDAAAVDRVVRGYDEACIWSRHRGRARSRMPRRVFVPADEPTFYGDFADRYRAGWKRALTRIDELAQGGAIEIGRMDCTYLNEAASALYDGPWVAERWCDLGGFVESHLGETFPVTERILRSGAREGLSAEALFTTMHFLQECRHRAARELADAVLVMPTCGGTFARAQVDEDPVATNSQMGLYTNHCNLCDLAAIAVPGDEVRDGLPFGITAFSLASQEHLLFGFASAL